MKIAFVTDDGVTITQHFGRAGKYLVVEVEEGKEVSRNLRDRQGQKRSHQTGVEHDQGGTRNHGQGGFQPHYISCKRSIHDQYRRYQRCVKRIPGGRIGKYV